MNEQCEKKDKRSEKNVNTTKPVEYDDLLLSAGTFGRYQIYLFISTFPFYLFGVFSYFSQLFMTEVSPNHWCWIPELENLSALERRSIAIPPDQNGRFQYSHCQTYVANWSEVLELGLKPNVTWETQPCQFGWEFNKTEIPYPTISSELGWVCDKNSYQATAQALFFVGSILGGFIVGWVADKFGRLPAAALSNLIGCFAGVISIFAQNMTQFSICRFIMGMSYDNNMMMTYLLVLEYVAPKYRTIIANMPFAFFYSLGCIILPWIALAAGHWKTLSLVTSAPMALALFAPFIIPESPQWLLSKGRTEEALSKIVKIGKINKQAVPSQLVEQFKLSTLNRQKYSEENISILDMLKKPILRKIFICMCFEFMCTVVVFDALVRVIGNLQFDFFISFTVLSFTELPSLLLVSFILDFTGRKWMSIFTLIISGLFCIMTSLVRTGVASIVCASIARFAVNMGVNIGMQWAAEMLPTPVRGSGASIVHICSYFATILSPYIVYLENFIPRLPLIVVGIIAMIGALFAMVLPETTGIDMPQTLENTEDLINNQKFFDIPCLRKKNSNGKGNINPTFELN